MTTRNVELMSIIVDELANKKTFSQALKTVYVKRSVGIPFNTKEMNIEVEKLGLTTRSLWALKRTHLDTVNDVIEHISEKGVKNIKNFGVACGTEVFEAILDWCWNHMTKEQQTEFLIDTVVRNSGNVRA
jgi:DNA-directed RNA polymerase alpha subunit